MLELENLGLKKGDLIVVDTAPLIYLIEGPLTAGARAEERAAVLRWFAEEARSGSLRLAASTIAWTECLAGTGGDGAKTDAYRRVLSDSSLVVMENVDVAIADQAAALLSGPARPDFADALHLATAVTLGAAAVLTNDETWKKIVSKWTGKKPRTLLVDELVFEL